jgi:hypothetical protein
VDDEIVFWISVHQMRTACRDLPMEARAERKRRLLERGFESIDYSGIPE